MEIHNKYAHSSLFEDQMAKTVGGRGLILVLITAALCKTRQPPQASCVESRASKPELQHVSAPYSKFNNLTQKL